MKKRWIDKHYAAFDSPQKTSRTAPGHHLITPTRKMRLAGFNVSSPGSLVQNSSSIFHKWEDFRSWSCKKTSKLEKSLPHSCRRPANLNEHVSDPKIRFCDSMGWDVSKFQNMRPQLWTIPESLTLRRLNDVSAESRKLEEPKPP